jgi:NADH:ubiquinone oxidoreductase subunit 5 (subunit L)/multisubunit Na+/H+ antiporter MnhA subunit
MATSVHPSAPHDLPTFISAPNETDVLMAAVAVVLVIAVLLVGILFLRLHTLPERIAHKGQKVQFEIVAVLGLLALFTHVHLFWVAGLLLALVEFPDWGRSLTRMAGSLETLASDPPVLTRVPNGQAVEAEASGPRRYDRVGGVAPSERSKERAGQHEEPTHA